MAATTFPELMEIAGTEYDKLVVYFQFLKQDNPFKMLQMEPSTGKGGGFTQQMFDDPPDASEVGWQDNYPNNGISYTTYDAYLNRIVQQMPVDAIIAAEGNPVDHKGLPDQLMLHRDQTIQSVVRKFRDRYLLGQPATTTIGTNFTTAGVTAIEMGPRSCARADVHGTKGSVTARVHDLKWVTASDEISYRPYGETTYGPTVVITASNYHRVPLFNADGTKWIFLTCVPATLLAAGDITGDGTAANGFTVTPSKQITGFATLAHPSMRRYGNLSPTNPSATTGDAPTRMALSWLARAVRDSGSMGNSAILCDPDMYLYLENVMIALGLGNKTVEFMGSEFNTLAYGDTPIFYTDSMTETRKAPDGSTNVGRILGITYGNKMTGAHIRYNTIADVPGVNSMPQLLAGGSVNTGHKGDPIPSPFASFLIPPDGDNDLLKTRASMLVEPSVPRFDTVAWLDCIKYA
jgi:hypothetical protein